MRVVFRTDASADMGWGHVMRCLTLAQALTERGGECEFVCRRHPGHLAGRIEARGFSVHVLDNGQDGPISPNDPDGPAHEPWLGTDWRTDAEQTLAVLGEPTIDCMVVDHYGLDARWHRTVRRKARRLWVIDDLADRTLEADWVLDQNLGREPTDYGPWTGDEVRFLLGPKFALLRPEFVQWRAESLKRRTTAELSTILITLGGTDRLNVTPSTVRALLECPADDRKHLVVVMGRQAPGLEEVQAMQERYPHWVELKCDVDNMAHLMAESDLCIGAAGSTAWERCCLGLPTVQVVSADNQRPIARALAEAGAALTLETDRLKESLTHVLEALTTARLRQMSEIAGTLCDGRGTERVAHWIVTDVNRG